MYHRKNALNVSLAYRVKYLASINGSSNMINGCNSCEYLIDLYVVLFLYTVELNPDSKTELQVDECSISEDLSKGGYMKLIGRQEPTSDRYAKMVQTKMDGVDGRSTLLHVQQTL